MQIIAKLSSAILFVFMSAHASGWLPSSYAESATVHEAVSASRQALTGGHISDAIVHAERAVSLDPAHAEAWRQFGRALMLGNRDQEALQALEKAWKLDADWMSLSITWNVDLLLRMNRLDDANNLLKAIPVEGLRGRPNDTIIRWLGILLEKKRDSAAAMLISKILPSVADDTLKQLYAIFRQDILTGGIEGYDDVDDFNAYVDLRSLIHQQRARDLARRELSTEAVTEYEKAIRLNPGRASLWSDLGWHYWYGENWQDAANAWSRGLEHLDAVRPGWLAWIADAHFQAGNASEAIACVRRAVALSPTNERVVELRHFYYLATGLFREVEEIERNVAPDNIIEAMARGRARFVLSFDDLRQGLHALKNIRGEQSNVLMAGACRLVAESRPVHERIWLLHESLNYDPDGFESARSLGWLMWESGDDAEALRYWERAFRHDGPVADEDLVKVLEALVKIRAFSDARSLLDATRGISAWRNLADSAMRNGAMNAAVMLLERIVADNLDRKSSLQLSLIKALKGNCDAWSHELPALTPGDLPTFDHVEVDLLYEIAAICRDNQALGEIMRGYVGDQPYYDPLITTLLLGFADEFAMNSEPETAYTLYRRIIARDPASSAWLQAARLAPRFESPRNVDDFFMNALLAPVPPAVHYRIKAMQSRRVGKISDAVMFVMESLDRDSGQPDLRLELFDMLMADERYAEAVSQVNWWGARLRSRGTFGADKFSDMLVSLGREPEIFALWTESVRNVHDGVYFLQTAADALVRACRHDEAIYLIELGLRKFPAHQLFSRAIELARAKGDYEVAASLAEAGIESSPTPDLYRVSAEIAEGLFDWPAAFAYASEYLKHNPAHAGMNRLVARADDIINNTEGGAVIRNKAHGRNIPASIRRLKPLAQLAPESAVPVLAYKSLSVCQMDGQNHVGQLKNHMRQLLAAGYTFIFPFELEHAVTNPGQQVIMVLLHPSPDVLPELDAFMARHQVKVVLAVDVSVFRHMLPRETSRTSFVDLQQSGRWLVATTGPEHISNARGVASAFWGNPLVHRIIKSDESVETVAEMEARLNQWLGDAARSIPEGIPRMFVYPHGDCGHMSHNPGKEEVDILRNVTRKYFDYVLALDEHGFVTPGYDRMRIPFRAIPPPRTMELVMLDGADDINEYLRSNNPVIQAKVEMARRLNQQGQHARAHALYQEVSDSGVDPSLFMYDWGSNSLERGDLPAALSKLRTAAQAGSLDQDQVFRLLEKAEKELRPQLVVNFDNIHDTDDRSANRFGVAGHWHIQEDIRLGARAEHSNHRRTSLGDVDGFRLGMEGLWFFTNERRLRSELQWIQWSDNEPKNQAVGSLFLHSENRVLNGSWELGYQRDIVPTVEAIRENIRYDAFSWSVNSIMLNQFDAHARGNYLLRTDDNDAVKLAGQIVYRLMDSPYVGAGYKVRQERNDDTVPEYYSPEKLEYHALLGAFTGNCGLISYELNTEWGIARETATEWEDVWNITIRLAYDFGGEVQCFGGFTRMEMPTYEEKTWEIGLKARF